MVRYLEQLMTNQPFLESNGLSVADAFLSAVDLSNRPQLQQIQTVLEQSSHQSRKEFTRLIDSILASNLESLPTELLRQIVSIQLQIADSCTKTIPAMNILQSSYLYHQGHLSSKDIPDRIVKAIYPLVSLLSKSMDELIENRNVSLIYSY